ncbi:MaoC-like protein [Leptospira kirschneri serovar Bim str. 1051]|uniref:MaoC family dehydratase n=1 Tax=Leptospira kirschneri TaxID=29507 RepID=UPI00028988A9|nr:MaoC family dehydratase [Leptospira kirschneri]EMK15683.1 MaoC-like protein [Leptospira kirschneri serovar Bim str. PUO 1247]EMN05147.1 MaoC-like protein [Leptospira kirschneri serovar Bim str. 1051]
MKENDAFEEEVSFSQEDVKKYADMSGDYNPIHFDYEYTKKTIFKFPIMHGLIGASAFSRILGTIFPGEGTIYRKQSLNFILPMFVERKYKVILKIMEIDSIKGSARIETKIINLEGSIVLSGEAIVYNEKFKFG